MRRLGVSHPADENPFVVLSSAERTPPSLLTIYNLTNLTTLNNSPLQTTTPTNTMTRILSSITLVAMVATSAKAFAPADSRKRSFAVREHAAFAPKALHSHAMEQPPFFLDVVEREPVQATPPVVKKAAPKKKAGAHNTDGLFSPVVLTAKQVVGDDRLNKIRAKAISLHSDVISNFVKTSDSAVGSAVLKSLFDAADANHDGSLQQEELATALSALGFTWLQSKQIGGIFKRADKDENGAIDMEEFLNEAPKTLRTNLIKLAKKNGADMGLLA